MVVSFRLNSDGQVSDLKEVENFLGGQYGNICRSAILDSAPFQKWPASLRLALDNDYHELKFTFYYDL